MKHYLHHDRHQCPAFLPLLIVAALNVLVCCSSANAQGNCWQLRSEPPFNNCCDHLTGFIPCKVCSCFPYACCALLDPANSENIRLVDTNLQNGWQPSSFANVGNNGCKYYPGKCDVTLPRGYWCCTWEDYSLWLHCTDWVWPGSDPCGP